MEGSSEEIIVYYDKALKNSGWVIRTDKSDVDNDTLIKRTYGKGSYALAISLKKTIVENQQKYYIHVFEDKQYEAAESARKAMYDHIPHFYVYQQPDILKDILGYSYNFGNHEAGNFSGTKEFQADGTKKEIYDYYEKNLTEAGWVPAEPYSEKQYSFTFRKAPYYIDINFQKTGMENKQRYLIAVIQPRDSMNLGYHDFPDI